MSDKQDGGPAFPTRGVGSMERLADGAGMSLRDFFAGQIAAAIIAGGHPISKEAHPEIHVPRVAYEFADALITERAKERT